MKNKRELLRRIQLIAIVLTLFFSLLPLTFDQEPVKGATFGGSSSDSYDTTSNDIRGTVFTMGATGGTADNLTAWIRSSALGDASIAIYLNSTGELIGYTEEKALAANANNRFVTFNITSGGTLLANTDYILAWWNDGAGMRLFRMATGGYSVKDDEVYNYPTWSDPITRDNEYAYIYYIYCSYTETTDTDYYVSNTGNNANNGTHPNYPWQTIGKVTSELNGGVISQSDDIYFNRGDTFTDAELLLRLGGTSSDWMAIDAYGTGADPIFNAISGVQNGAIHLMTSVGFIKVQNIDITNSDSVGIRFSQSGITNITIFEVDITSPGGNGMVITGCDHLILENITVSGATTSAGIVIYGRDSGTQNRNTKALNCTVSTCNSDGFTYHQSDGLGTNIGANHYLYNCKAYGITGEQGFDITSGTDIYIKDCESYENNNGGIVIGHDTERVTIDNFYLHDEDDEGMIFSSTDFCRVRNSTFYNSGTSGTGRYILDHTVGLPVENLNIYNCHFIFENPTRRVRLASGDMLNVNFKNNLYCVDSDATGWSDYYFHMNDLMSTKNFNHSYNIYWRNGDSDNTDRYVVQANPKNFNEWNAYAETYQELRQNPLLYDIDNEGFNLTSSSPAIDSGDWLTTCNGGNTGTTITVHDSNYFFEGISTLGVSGDKIFVGDDTNLEITDVDYTNEQITVNRSITWVDGDNVSLSNYIGSAPDRGAWEYTDSGNPTISGEIPVDAGTGISLTPTCNVTVNDPDGDSMDVTFASNYTGSWLNYQTNASSANGSYQWDFTGANSWSTKYFWKVYCNDGTANISETYDFTTIVNNSPVITGEVPADSATGITLQPTCNATVNDIEDTMNVTFASNYTGSWLNYQTNASSANGSYQWDFTGASSWNTKYWWRVYCNDSLSNISETYSFTTTMNSVPVISGEIPANGSSGISIQPNCFVQVNDIDADTMDVTFASNYTGSWVNYQTNASVANSTVNWSFTGATSWGTEYFWRAYCYDVNSSNVSETYYFTTTVNNSPVISSPNPANWSVGVSHTPTCNVTVTDPESDTMTVDWYASESGVIWTHKQTNTSVASGSNVTYVYTPATLDDHIYFWKVYCNDSINNVSRWYRFRTTGSSLPVIENPIPSNGSTVVTVDVNWSVEIHDDNPFNWTIECNGQNSSDNLSTSGIFYLNLTNLSVSTYTVYVNASNGGVSISRWYTFTVQLTSTEESGGGGGAYIPVQIKILDVEGNPVAFHYVYLYQYGYLKDRAITNLEGIAEFVVLPGTYAVQTMLDDELREITFDVDLENGKNQILSFSHAPYPQFRLNSPEFLIFFFVIVIVLVLIVYLKKITTKK